MTGKNDCFKERNNKKLNKRHTLSLAFPHVTPDSAITSYAQIEEKQKKKKRKKKRHTPSRLSNTFLQTAIIGYAPEGAFFISA